MPLPGPPFLATLMEQKVDALSDAEKADRKKTYLALAEAIDQYIKAGTVNVTGVTASACAAGGAVGTCTATGTIT